MHAWSCLVGSQSVLDDLMIYQMFFRCDFQNPQPRRQSGLEAHVVAVGSAVSPTLTTTPDIYVNVSHTHSSRPIWPYCVVCK